MFHKNKTTKKQKTETKKMETKNQTTEVLTENEVLIHIAWYQP